VERPTQSGRVAGVREDPERTLGEAESVADVFTREMPKPAAFQVGPPPLRWSAGRLCGGRRLLQDGVGLVERAVLDERHAAQPQKLRA
jgi:hypothetical protein